MESISTPVAFSTALRMAGAPLVAGVPAKVRRELDDEERAGIIRNAETYRTHTQRHIDAVQESHA